MIYLISRLFRVAQNLIFSDKIKQTSGDSSSLSGEEIIAINP